MKATILIGDVIEQLRTLPSDSVHCVVTSPPYWGLRDYGVAGQIGLEPTPAEFIAKMVAVFAEVRRVLRSDGTCWVNMGDSYSSHPNQRVQKGEGRDDVAGWKQASNAGSCGVGSRSAEGLKPKDLMGMPWRLAFALQDDGWWLRQDIIWSKPNPMPESVTDRCTKAHEYIFLLTKSAKYYYDAEAIKEDAVEGRDLGLLRGRGANGEATQIAWDAPSIKKRQEQGIDSRTAGSGKRNKRSVWEIATEPFPEAHFATFPTKLVEPCILAGTSEKGVCDNCWTPWVRIVEKTGGTIGESWHDHTDDGGVGQRVKDARGKGGANSDYKVETLGWKLGCSCETNDAVPSTVLDPFSGSGTTGLVALANRCNYIGIELSPEYAAMSQRRIDALLQQEVLAFA